MVCGKCFLGSVPVVVLAVHHALPYPRNFLPLYPLVVVVAAAGLTRFPRTNRRTQLSGAAVVAILLVVVGVGSLRMLRILSKGRKS